MNQQERLRAQREGGQVTRCHTTPHHRHYDNAQHSFNMLLLLFELHPNPSMQMVRAVMYHDLAERYTGDLPSTVRHYRPEVKEEMVMLAKLIDDQMGTSYHWYLTNDDEIWLKALDDLEFYLWCCDQSALGNFAISVKIEAMHQCFDKLRAAGRLPDPVDQFLKEFKNGRGPERIEI